MILYLTFLFINKTVSLKSDMQHYDFIHSTHFVDVNSCLINILVGAFYASLLYCVPYNYSLFLQVTTCPTALFTFLTTSSSLQQDIVRTFSRLLSSLPPPNQMILQSMAVCFHPITSKLMELLLLLLEWVRLSANQNCLLWPLSRPMQSLSTAPVTCCPCQTPSP